MKRITPNTIIYFEPGCISCIECGWKPEDKWATDPEGFEYHESLGWVCDECDESLNQSDTCTHDVLAKSQSVCDDE